jgi:hypothetical protein
MLKDEAMKWFKQKGMQYASIDTAPGNKHAHNIYKKWGFLNVHLSLTRKI